jgi:hypothetical protein
MTNQLNLNTIFKTVTDRLAENQDVLNQKDDFNHDHGDHMVEIFKLAQSAVAKKSKAPVNEQLQYASEVVAKEGKSGSAKLYADGFSKAAAEFSNNDLTAGNIGNLVKAILGTEDDKGTQAANQLGSLLSGATGDNQTQEKKSLGIDELFRAGLSFFQTKQNGGSTSDAVINAMIAASPMGQSAHRAQSGMLVGSTIMNVAQSFMNK